MSPPALNRRRLLAGAAATAIGSVGTWAVQAVDPRRAVIWGSSSASSHRFDEPDHLREVTIHDELAALGVPTVEHGYGAWQSPEILAIRSSAHPLRPDLSAAGGVLPSRGKIEVPVLDRIVPTLPATPIPGTVGGIEVGMTRADEDAEDDQPLLALHRTHPGDSMEVGSQSQSTWTTSLEDRYRGCIHVLWMGANNIEEPDQVLADTAAAFETDPEATLVMTHWKSWWKRAGTDGAAWVDRVNSGYRAMFGEHCLDITAAMWDPRWWELPEVAELELHARTDSGKRRARGLVPEDFVADDTIHLNGYGNLVLAHALHHRMRSLEMI